MKLTEIYLENVYQLSQHRIGSFANGLNIIYGARGTGKSTIRQLVRDTFYGTTRFMLEATSVASPTTPKCRVTIASSLGDYRLERDFTTNGALQAEPISDARLTNQKLYPNLLDTLKPELFDTIYSFSMQRTPENASLLSHALRTELDVPAGRGAIGERTANLNWDQENEARRQRCASINHRMEVLQLNRQKRIQDTHQIESGRRVRLTELEREIQTLASQISQFDVNGKRTQLAMKEREIAELRLLIEESIRMESLVPASAINSHRSDLYQLIYARLDELDNQIRRWKGLQADVQNQRIRQKDEMTAWGDQTLESPEHPYHNTRRVLTTLEERVLQVDLQARQWEAAPANRTDPSQSVRTIQSICQSMKSELCDLAEELSVQYKNIRHRGAAAELKYLRHCFDAISDNIERLALRREVIISEIRAIDPPGFDAIARAESQFIHCAQHEGFFAARKKFVGGLSPLQEVVTTPMVRTDIVELRRRLALNQAELNELQRWTVDSDASLLGWKSRQSQLELERNGLMLVIADSNTAEIARIDQELALLRDELGKLMLLIAQRPTMTPVAGNSILLRAGLLMHQVTHGELKNVWLSEKTSNGLEVLDRNNNVRTFSDLDAKFQDAVFLSLAFAAKEGLANRGVVFPMLVDDVFEDGNHERLTNLVNLMSSMANSNHQIILFTSQSQLDSRMTAGAVFALPNSTEAISITRVLPSGLPSGFTQVRESIPVTILPSLNQTISPQIVANHRLDNLDQALPRLRDYEFEMPAIASFLPEREYSFSNHTNNRPAVTEKRDRSEDYDQRVAPERADFIVPYPTQGGKLPRSSSAGRAIPVAVDSVADQLGFAPAFDEFTNLDRLDLLDVNRLRTLSEIGIESVGQLLELNPDDLPALLRDRGISSDQIDRWQAISWLLSNIPGLRAVDAKILVACGVTEPEHLASSHSHQLLERIQRFLNSSEGQRHGITASNVNLTRVTGWLRALETTRSRWQRGNGLSRISRRQVNRERGTRTQTRNNHEPRLAQLRESFDGDGSSTRRDVRPIRVDRLPERDSGEALMRTARPRSSDHPASIVIPSQMERDFRGVEPRYDSKKTPDYDRDARNLREPRVDRETRPERKPRLEREVGPEPGRRFEREPRMEPRTQREPSTEYSPPMSFDPNRNQRSSSQKVASDASSEKQRFYLDLKDHIEAAPSIGPKTAELFERIGVSTVEEFLQQAAESLATKLKYKKITSDLILEWQHQARLVCRVPNLRGHDAQLLVACNFIEPEKIATLQPQRLLDVILPFARSKEGLKIIRNGKEPDLVEVADWIKWASMTRSLHAA